MRSSLITAGAGLSAADNMLATGPGYEAFRVGSFGRKQTVPIKGSCHCGQTQFEVSALPADVTRCSCSLCSKRGALWAYYTPAQFT